MKKLILIFSHILTERQTNDAKESLNIEDFVYLPPDLQDLWSSIPPDVKDISDIMDKIKEWISGTADKKDYILVQGDFGATYDVVGYCKATGLKAVYSTTRRNAKEILREDGTIETIHVFEHVMFREY